jgi:hypothetical protein
MMLLQMCLLLADLIEVAVTMVVMVVVIVRQVGGRRGRAVAVTMPADDVGRTRGLAVLVQELSVAVVSRMVVGRSGWDRSSICSETVRACALVWRLRRQRRRIRTRFRWRRTRCGGIIPVADNRHIRRCDTFFNVIARYVTFALFCFAH